MKRDEIITVKSTLGKKSKKPQKTKKQTYDFSMNDKDLSGLKSAMVILPIVIIAIIVVVLIVGINEYNSMFGNVDKESSVQSGQNEKTEEDESKLLMLVSPENPLPSDYKMNLVSYGEYEFDKSIIPALKEMTEAASKDGISLKIVGGYVSPEVQHELYIDEVSKLMADEGYVEARAMDEAEKIIPMENRSEYQSGLAVKFGSSNDTDFAQSDEYRWLYNNSIKYGFILRYPQDKESETGFKFDSTQFRYVGKENATRMRSLNLTLDEYLIYLDSRA